MSTSFQLSGLDPAPFRALFGLPADALRRHGAVRCVADARPGFPCRIGLDDAAVGETLLLLPFEHQPADTPYRASGPVFVREGAVPRALAIGEVPPYVTNRLISLRAYDGSHRIVDATVRDGPEVASALGSMFDNRDVAYIHLHNAKQGCFSCRADRIST